MPVSVLKMPVPVLKGLKFDDICRSQTSIKMDTFDIFVLDHLVDKRHKYYSDSMDCNYPYKYKCYDTVEMYAACIYLADDKMENMNECMKGKDTTVKELYKSFQDRFGGDTWLYVKRFNKVTGKIEAVLLDVNDDRLYDMFSDKTVIYYST